MCVRTQSLRKRTKVQPIPSERKKCQMTSPPSFNLVVISNGIFAEHKKKGPLNPLRISPRFLVRGLAGCRQRREDPGSLILWFFFPVVLGYMAYNVTGGMFPPLRPYVPGRSCPPLALVESVRSFSLQYVRYIYIYIQYSTVITFRT